MNEDDRKNMAEKWIDSALDRYTEAEPRPGYETRLLATVASARPRQPRSRGIWTWAAVGAAAALMMALVALSIGRHARTHTPEIATVPPPTQSPVVTEQQSRAMPPPVKNPSVLVARKNPTKSRPRNVHQRSQQQTYSAQQRRPQFPTPAPLTEQEQLLLAYVRNTPVQEIETVIAQKEAFQRHVDSLGVPEKQEKTER